MDQKILQARRWASECWREVEVAEAELTKLLSHREKLRRSFSVSAFPDGYESSTPLYAGQLEGRLEESGIRSNSGLDARDAAVVSSDSEDLPESLKHKPKKRKHASKDVAPAWTQVVRKRSMAIVHDGTSSDSEDNISIEVLSSKESPSLSPTRVEEKPKSAAESIKATAQGSILSPDAPPEDVFDWQVLGLSGAWTTNRPSSCLLAESSWSQQLHQQRSLPCEFDSVNDYKSSFAGLILEECKAQLTRDWEMLRAAGSTPNISEEQGDPEKKMEPSLWQFRTMYPAKNDPFTYFEAEVTHGPLTFFDFSEIVLVHHNDTSSLAVVVQSRHSGILLRTRADLQDASGMFTLDRLTNVVTLKRQYLALSKVSEIWHPLLQQLLHPLENTSSLISPPDAHCPEEEVTVSSCREMVLTWKRKKILNERQLTSLDALLQLKQGFLLIQGPPGTGKTSTIVGMVSALHIEEPGAKVLVCASSNAAVDEIVSRLMDSMVSKAGYLYSPENGKLVRFGVQASIQPACLPVTLDAILQGRGMTASSRVTRQETLNGASVVCCTISGCGQQVFDEANQKFDLVIVDEAAQALESEVLIALHRVKGRCVLVGDPCQLPAVVLQKPGVAYGRSLFERMQDAGLPVFRMATQYRMHPQISKFPSSQFYGGRLKDSPQSTAVLPIFKHGARAVGIDVNGYNFRLGPYFFLDVTWGTEQGQLVGFSLSNTQEAEVVTTLVQGVVQNLRHGLAASIGVITPYLAQRSLIIDSLTRYGLDANACEVNTVDGFQGREKDIIILSCVRAQTENGLGFVSDVRRMNVALTRARHSLIIVGHAETLRRQSSAWRALLEDASTRGLYQVLRHEQQCPRVAPKVFPRQGSLDDLRDVSSDHAVLHAGRKIFRRGAPTPSPPVKSESPEQNVAGWGRAGPTERMAGRGVSTPSPPAMSQFPEENVAGRGRAGPDHGGRKKPEARPGSKIFPRIGQRLSRPGPSVPIGQRPNQEGFQQERPNGGRFQQRVTNILTNPELNRHEGWFEHGFQTGSGQRPAHIRFEQDPLQSDRYPGKQNFLSNRKRRQSSPWPCNRCGRMGHIARFCPS